MSPQTAECLAGAVGGDVLRRLIVIDLIRDDDAVDADPELRQAVDAAVQQCGPIDDD